MAFEAAVIWDMLTLFNATLTQRLLLRSIVSAANFCWASKPTHTSESRRFYVGGKHTAEKGPSMG